MHSNSEKFKLDIHTPIINIINDYPELAEVLTYEYGIPCVNCMIAEYDTLAEGAKYHGINEDDWGDMIKHLEEIINSDRE